MEERPLKEPTFGAWNPQSQSRERLPRSITDVLTECLVGLERALRGQSKSISNGGDPSLEPYPTAPDRMTTVRPMPTDIEDAETRGDIAWLAGKAALAIPSSPTIVQEIPAFCA
jgi:hypothetical protein